MTIKVSGRDRMDILEAHPEWRRLCWCEDCFYAEVDDYKINISGFDVQIELNAKYI